MAEVTPVGETPEKPERNASGDGAKPGDASTPPPRKSFNLFGKKDESPLDYTTPRKPEPRPAPPTSYGSAPPPPSAASSARSSVEDGFAYRDKSNREADISGAGTVAALVQVVERLIYTVGSTRTVHVHGAYVEHNNGAIQGFGPGGSSSSAAGGSAATAPQSWPAVAFHACGRDYHALAYLVASAALEGEGALLIAEKASALAERMIEGMPDDALANMRGAMFNARKSVNTKFEAFALAEDATGGAVRLRFTEPNAPPRVLTYAASYLTGLPNWPTRLREWIKALGEDTRLDVRRAAGRAAAIFAEAGGRLDIAPFEDWIGSVSSDPCDAVDAALAFLIGTNSTLRDEAMSQLEAWSKGSRGANGYFAARRCAENLVGIVDQAFSLKLLRTMLRANEPSAAYFGVSGFARVLWLAMPEPNRLPNAARAFCGALEDAREQRKWSLRNDIMHAAVLAAAEDSVDHEPSKLTAFERANGTDEGGRCMAELLRDASKCGDGVSVVWLKLLRTLFLRAARRNLPAGEEPFLRFYRALANSAADAEDRAIAVDRLRGLIEGAGDRAKHDVAGARALLAELTGEGVQ